MLRSFLLLTCIAVSAARSGCSRRFGVTHRPAAKLDDILALRGGAGPLDPSAVMKTASAIAGLQGLVMQFDPEGSGTSYGLDEEKMGKPSNQLMASYAGTGILTWAAQAAYLAFVDGATAKGAYLTNVHIWIYENFRVILGKQLERSGAANSNGAKLANVINILGLVAMTQEKYSTTALKVISGFWIINGLRMILDPAGAKAQWGFAEMDDVGQRWMQQMGHGLIAQSVVLAAMTMLDYDGLKALGLGSISWVVSHLYGILSGTDDKLGVPRKPMLFWLAYHAVVIYSTLF